MEVETCFSTLRGQGGWIIEAKEFKTSLATSAFQSAEITGVSHHAKPAGIFF